MKDFFSNLKNSLTFNKYSLINSLKTTLACLVGLIISKLLKLNQPQWVLISILVVMAAQYRLGGAIKKGYDRLLATFIGSFLALMILLLFSPHVAFIYITLFLSIGMFIYLATNSKEYSYAYSLGAVTMVVIIVSNTPQFSNAVDRLAELLLGIVLAILTSRFIFPIHAEKILLKNIAGTLQCLKKVYQFSICEEKTFDLNNREMNLEEEILQDLAAQPGLLKEACTESVHIAANKFKFTLLLRLERRLLRSIYMMHHTLRLSLKNFDEIIALPEFKILYQQIVTTIETIATKIENKNYSFTDIDLDSAYKEIILKLKIMFNQYSFEDKNKIHAFIFCLGHVISLLNQMKKLINAT